MLFTGNSDVDVDVDGKKRVLCVTGLVVVTLRWDMVEVSG